jgi:hypothetical protein
MTKPTPSPDAFIATQCDMCNNPTTSVCARCHSSRYCSKVCQKDAWSVHKLLCQSFEDFDVESSPPDSYRAILFAPVERKPQFFWLKMCRAQELTGPGAGGEEKWALSYEGVPHRDTFPSDPDNYREFAQNPVTKRPHGMINMIGTAAQDGENMYLMSEPNKSYEKIDPILVNTIRDPQIYCANGRNLDMTDFQHIVDWARCDLYKVYRQPARIPGAVAQGVRINCTGDTEISDRPQLEVTEVNDSFFTMSRPLRLPVSERIGIPMLVQKVIGPSL